MAQGVAAGLGPGDRRLLAERFVWWHLLTAAERGHLEDLAAAFLAVVDVEAARGFEVDRDMAVLVAGQAALPLVGLAGELGPLDAMGQYRDVTTVVLHPTTVVQSHERPAGIPGVVTTEPEHLLGQAQLHGPVLLAWDEVERSLRHPGRGRNVVFHEFAHKLDMRDGNVNGTPLLGDASDRRRWHDLATRQFRRLRRGPDAVLRRYGATNPAEFFAVVLESFLDDPLRLRGDKPELYELLQTLFRFDPAARVEAMLLTVGGGAGSGQQP